MASVTTGAACSPLICLHQKWTCGFMRGVLLRLQNPYPPNMPMTACVQLGFLPLNHLMGRMTLLKCLLTGGQVHQRLQPAEQPLRQTVTTNIVDAQPPAVPSPRAPGSAAWF